MGVIDLHYTQKPLARRNGYSTSFCIPCLSSSLLSSPKPYYSYHFHTGNDFIWWSGADFFSELMRNKRPPLFVQLHIFDWFDAWPWKQWCISNQQVIVSAVAFIVDELLANDILNIMVDLHECCWTGCWFHPECMMLLYHSGIKWLVELVQHRSIFHKNVVLDLSKSYVCLCFENVLHLCHHVSFGFMPLQLKLIE